MNNLELASDRVKSFRRFLLDVIRILKKKSSAGSPGFKRWARSRCCELLYEYRFEREKYFAVLDAEGRKN